MSPLQGQSAIQHKRTSLIEASTCKAIPADSGGFCIVWRRQFLIIVDCKTGWPDVIDMRRDTTAQKLTNVLRGRTAVPDVLWSDGGPQSTSSKFANFLVNWGTSHITPSPHYPQSNGQAEAAVKSMKKLVSAAWQGKSVNWEKLSRSLLQYRNTPCRKDGLSPAQKLFGHPVQDSRQPTAVHLHQSGRSHWKKLTRMLVMLVMRLNKRTISIPESSLISKLETT